MSSRAETLTLNLPLGRPEKLPELLGAILLSPAKTGPKIMITILTMGHECIWGHWARATTTEHCLRKGEEERGMGVEWRG
jgi:hypothetical protein